MNRLVFAAFGLIGATAFASGFALSEHDAAATGRSGTATARAGSVSATHFNPAGLAGLDGAHASIGVTAIAPTATAQDPASGTIERTNPAIAVPPHAYGAYASGDFAFGVGVNAPFGGGLVWPADWRGRYELIHLTLQVIGIHASAAYQLSPKLALGAGVTLFNVGVSSEQRLDFIDSEGTALMAGSGRGLSASFGAVYSPTERLRLGAVAKLPSHVEVTGSAHFENVPPAFSSMLQDQGATSGVTLPGKVGLGAEVDLRPVRLFADAEVTFWGAFERFKVEFEQEAMPALDKPHHWFAAPTFRLGGELEVPALGPSGVVRAGGMYDGIASPANTLAPSLPDSHRVGATLGVGRRFGEWRADLAYMFMAFLPRSTEGDAFPARYAANGHLLALTVGYR